MTPPNPNSWAKSCIHPGIWGPRKPSMKSSPICNCIRYCSPADPMVPKLSDSSTNVKDRSPDEPIARGASESSRFQDYSALLSGPQRNIQRCECRDRGECRGAIGSCACVARHAFNSSINDPGMATVRHRLPDFGDHFVAVASSVGGMAMPRVLALLRLMTSLLAPGGSGAFFCSEH